MMNEKYLDNENDLEDEDLIDNLGQNYDDRESKEKAKEEEEAKKLDLANAMIKEARKYQRSTSVPQALQKLAGINVGQSNEFEDKKNAAQLDARLNGIIDKIGLYQNMSKDEIDKLKREIVNEPIAVLQGLSDYYTQNIEPVIKQREADLKNCINQHQKENTAIFLYVNIGDRDPEDGTFKEQSKIMSVDTAKRPGFEIYHGQVVQQMRPDQTPFDSPSVLFAPEEKPEEKLENNNSNNANKMKMR